MSLTAKASSYKPLEPGEYAAICIGVIDLGSQESKFGTKQQVYLDFLCFDNEGGEQTIGKFYTTSLHENANLRQHLESWRDQPVTDDELQGFELGSVIHKPAMVFVSNTNGDKPRAQIDTIKPLPIDFAAPTAPDKPAIYNMDHPDLEVFDRLPDFLKKKIEAAREYRESGEPTVVDKDANTEDDVPF